jgi:hypothetical protein
VKAQVNLLSFLDNFYPTLNLFGHQGGQDEKKSVGFEISDCSIFPFSINPFLLGAAVFNPGCGEWGD